MSYFDRDPKTPEGAFLAENPFAAAAEQKLRENGARQQASEARRNHAIEAEALATLAVAYEQRLTRFDLDATLNNHVGHWLRP